MKKILRQQISEILVKWSMPTRQAAIDEIIAAVRERDKYVVGEDENEIVRNPGFTISSLVTFDKLKGIKNELRAEICQRQKETL